MRSRAVFRAADGRVGLGVKPIHMASLVDDDGNISPLCATEPRGLDLRRETWTMRGAAVTCKRCRALLKGHPAGVVPGA